ncbi:MAG: hypothetical protein GY820_19670 [Gammaproteobacteria bacterium]|nr:hypothetical protein [Gammaproteobacteria bacterium]
MFDCIAAWRRKKFENLKFEGVWQRVHNEQTEGKINDPRKVCKPNLLAWTHNHGHLPSGIG